jgi:ATP-dependent helicase/nuclease subunit A
MLTTHQEQALDTTRHLSVTANAGAGKTTVLVRRYIDILRTGSARVHEIVAITYTEKAASELRKKIADQLEERINGGGGASPDESARLLAARNQLASATIGTIHSFCAQILREYPVEADVDAAFTVLEGTDQQGLLQESLAELLAGLIGKKGAPGFEPVVDAVRILGKKSFQNHLKYFLSNREKMERLLASPGGAYARERSDAEILNAWRAAAEEEVLRACGVPAWRRALETVLLRCAGKKKAGAEEAYRAFLAAAPGSRIPALKALTEILFTQKFELRKDVTGPADVAAEAAAEAELLAGTCKGLAGLLAALADPGAAAGSASLLRTTRTLLDVYQRASALYEEKKQEQGGLDFEDLQLKTRSLLNDPAIRAKLSERYTYVMVDEFQDTNQLQYDILRLLIAEYAGANLFIVGDPKQSIYGFRNAEVEVFSSAKEDIVRAADGRDLTLAESFRPLTQIALFVNALFSDLMGSSGSAFDIPYADLVRGRAAAGDGRVELHLLAPEPLPGETADPVARECETVARRILELARSAYPVHDGRAELVRPFAFRDAAILLRKRTHLRQMEHALIRYRIPYLLSGGIGFYQTQEIVDFLNYFSFLLNPENDVALAGILRSPFFTVSDLVLYEVSLVRKGASFWDKFREYVRVHPEEGAAATAAAVLKADLALANRLSIPLLVQRIFRVTGWRGTVAGLARGEQHAANIAKLLRIAREFEGRGLSTLYDFLQRLKALVDSEEREGQASLDLGGNAVHVMTIHAAKGLEFPAVFLPFAHEPFRYDGALLVDTEIGVGFPLQQEEDLDQEAVLPTLELLKLRNRQRVEAEEKRVLYVAATRARDFLAVSGRLSRTELRTSYLRWMMESLGLHAAALAPGALSLPASPLRILAEEGGAFVARELTAPLVLHVNPPLAEAAAPPVLAQGSGADAGDDGRYLPPLSGQTRGEFFSATQIRTFLECPSKYYLKYVLGLPESSAPPAAFDEEEEPSDVIVGEAEGAYTHAALQDIIAGDITGEEVRERVMTLLAAETHLSGEQQGALADRIAGNVLGFLRSAAGREVLSAVEVKTEFSVQTLFGEDFLTGIIDRLYKTPAGEWRIIDYKTDRVDARHLAARAELYKPQLAFYALLVRRLFRQESIRATLLFLKQPERPVHYDFTQADTAAFEETVRGIIARIRARDFSRTVRLCDSCTYQKEGRCLLGQRG